MPNQIWEEYSKVLVGEYLGTEREESTATIRIRKATEKDGKGAEDMPDIDFVLEIAIKCGPEVCNRSPLIEGCGTVNWILAGTDPGDYRCIKCTAWL